MYESLIPSVKNFFYFQNAEQINSLKLENDCDEIKKVYIFLSDEECDAGIDELCFNLRERLEQSIVWANRRSLLLHASSVLINNTCLFVLGSGVCVLKSGRL